MKHFKIRRINKVNVITIDGDVTIIKLTDREIGKLSYKLESFVESQTIKEDKNFRAKMAQE